MYFPILRGRQFELLALRECVNKSFLSNKIIPIVEPVKVSSTYTKTVDSFIKAGKPIAVIRNPQVGSYDNVYLQSHALLKNNDWDAFVTEIKTKNRYHSKLINFDILEKYCSFIRKTYKTGDLFYRARISEQTGYPISEMSAPPAGKSSEGRANARGITCLYVASDVDTTLHEVRAGVFDFVSVGTFRLKQDITVVDLRAITEISPFVDGLEYLDHAINKQYLEKLNSEMSKSLRRSDSTLDYVPTQYIVDFIKSIEHNGSQEYDGIEYNSTTNPGGYNLAIFNPDLFECVSVSVYDIEKLQYTSKRVL